MLVDLDLHYLFRLVCPYTISDTDNSKLLTKEWAIFVKFDIYSRTC